MEYPSQKTVIVGLVATIVGLLMVHHMVGNPLTDGFILLWGKETEGQINWTHQDYDEAGPFFSLEYQFRVGGHTFTSRYTRDGELNDEFYDIDSVIPVKVEYYPHMPSLSRIKGNGTQSVFEWVWRKLLLGSLLYAAFLAPGVFLLRGEWKKWLAAKHAEAKSEAE